MVRNLCRIGYTCYGIQNDKMVWARMNLIYFAISFSHPILRYESKDTQQTELYGGFWRKFDVQHNFPEMEGRELKAGFVFDLSDGRSLEIKVAISAVDKERALLNLKKETQGKNFDKVLAEAKSKMEQSCIFYFCKWNRRI